MEKFALLVGVLLLLPVAHFSGAALQVKANATIDSDLKNSSNSDRTDSSNEETGKLASVLDHTRVDQVKNEKDQEVGSKGDLGNGLGKNNSSGNTNSKKDYNLVIGKGGSNDEFEAKKLPEKDGSKNQVGGSKVDIGSSVDNSNSSGKTESGKDHNVQEENGGLNDDKNKEVPEDKGTNGNMASSNQAGEEGSSGDDCYSSINCVDEENKMVACLRVPGNDSPHLSLLIQNKGNKTLAVKIIAPDFVQLDRTKVRVNKKDNERVQVSIGDGGTDSLIVLATGNGKCSLDFRDLIGHGSSPKFAYISLPTRRPFTFLFFSALLILVLAWGYIRRRKLSYNRFMYQKLDVGLPFSFDGKSKLEDNDGWDESWGDDWNDEETPRTPSKPSPSLSSKRLASRRLSKEGRKD
ncbi:hypothetical protein UlMin_042504 [Ulmus minor]